MITPMTPTASVPSGISGLSITSEGDICTAAEVGAAPYLIIVNIAGRYSKIGWTDWQSGKMYANTSLRQPRLVRYSQPCQFSLRADIGFAESFQTQFRLKLISVGDRSVFPLAISHCLVCWPC